MQTIAEHADVTQRNLSQKLGLALGLTNHYLKKCVKKGLVKIEQTPTNRYFYYLTPKGFSEKGRLTVGYLNNSLNFYRRIKKETEVFIKFFSAKSYCNIAFVGESDLVEIALLVAKDTNLSVELFKSVRKKKLSLFDAVVISGTNSPSEDI